jgi:hypothetical protein
VVRQTDEDVKRYWCDITFADRGRLALSHEGPDKQKKYSRAEFSLGRKPARNIFQRTLTPAFKFFLSAEATRTAAVWRHLRVEVRPEKVNVFWEGQALPELSRAKLRELCQSWVVGNKVVVPEFEFAPDGAVGLYVSQGKASFRHVTIEPLE